MKVVVKLSGNRKTKVIMGHVTKKILTPPSKKLCPLFDEAKKEIFFTPLPPVCSNVTFWAILLEGIPNISL